MENSDSLPIEVTDHDSRQEILKCVKDMKQDLANWMMKIENEVKLRLDRSLNAEMELLPTDTRATRQQQDHSLEMAEQTIADSTHGKSEEPLSEGEKKKLEKIEQIREKYLRLLISLGCSFEDSLAAKVLNQINIAESRSCSQTVGLHSAKKAAMELEVHTKNDLDLCLSILVIGKTGVGKSATINSILGENKMVTNAFEPATTDVTEIISTIDGIKIKFLDTPGLRTSHTDQSKNRKILLSLKKIMQKNPPDLVLYVDRLDTQTSNSDDLPLLKSITTYLGTSIWCKCIIGLTHAASLPPDGPDGYPLRYESIVDRRSGDLQGLLSHLAEEPVILPVGLVENQRGENLLLNGESWKLRLLLMCSSIKTLADLDFVIKSPIKSNLTMFGIQIPFYSKLPHSERHKNYMLDDTSSENEALTTLPPSIDPNTRSAHDHRSTLLLTWPIPTFVDGVITLVGKVWSMKIKSF